VAARSSQGKRGRDLPSPAVVLAFGALGRQPLFETEEGREMLGLLLVVIWMGLLTLFRRSVLSRH
jgi:hypothetical protein